MYHQHKIHLTSENGNGLREGHTVHIKKEHLKGEHCVHLTQQQITRIEKCLSAGKKTTLKFSPKQLKFNQQGGGFFGDILKKGLTAVAPLVKDTLSGLAQQGINKVVDVGVNKISGNGLDELRAQHGEGIFDTLLPIIAQMVISGKGIPSTPKKSKSKKGGSFVPSGY